MTTAIISVSANVHHFYKSVFGLMSYKSSPEHYYLLCFTMLALSVSDTWIYLYLLIWYRTM